MPTPVPTESFESVKALIKDVTKELEEANALLLKKAKAISKASIGIETAKSEAAQLIRSAEEAKVEAQQQFRAQKAYTEKIAARVETLHGLIQGNLIDSHPSKVEAMLWRQERGAGINLGLDGSRDSIQVFREERYIGEVVRIRPDRHSTTYTFAPYRCIEMKAIGPFGTVAEALDAAVSVTPYEPDMHDNAALGSDVGYGAEGDSVPFGTITEVAARLNALDAARTPEA